MSTLISTPLPRMRVIQAMHWKNDLLTDVSLCALVLSASLPNFCDDRGAKLANPTIIRSECFATQSNVSVEMVKNALEELVDCGFIKMFKIETYPGKEFFMINLGDQKIEKPNRSYLDGNDFFVDMISKEESKLFGRTEKIEPSISLNNVHIDPIIEEKLSTESIEIVQKDTRGTSVKLCGTILDSRGTIENSCGTSKKIEAVDKNLESPILEPFKSSNLDNFFSPLKEKKRKEKNIKNKRFFLNKKEEEEKNNLKENIVKNDREKPEQKIISPIAEKYIDEIRKIVPNPTKRHLDESEVSQTPITKPFNPMKPVAELFGELVGGLGA